MSKDKNSYIDNYKETITRANTMIRAKYASSLLENKLVVLALKKANKDSYGRLTVAMTTEEIRGLMAIKGNGIYDSLKTAALSMAKRTMFMEDKKNKEFKIINLIDSAQFKNGVFTVAFTPEVNQYIEDLQESYTTLPINILFSFKSNHSYRLYEILSVHEYKIGKDNVPVAVEYGLSELRLELNLVNTTDPKIEKELQSKHPDYDKIVNELSLEKNFERWVDFSRYVLKHAIKEINEKTKMHVEFKPVKSGKGGRVVGVIFFISRNEEVEESDIVEDVLNKEEQYNAIVAVTEYLSTVKLSRADVITLLKVADWDVDKIKRAHNLAQKQDEIKNYMGWMTDCIKKGYSEPVETMSGSSYVADSVREFHDSINSDKSKIANNVWKRIKNGERFQDFIVNIALDEALLEELYNVEELVSMYTEWVKSGKIVV